MPLLSSSLRLPTVRKMNALLLQNKSDINTYQYMIRGIIEVIGR